MDQRTTEPNWGTYNEQFRRDAHQLIAWGYQDARNRMASNMEEEDISGFITEAIKNRLDSPDAPSWVEHYFVDDEVRIGHGNRTGKARRRLDIVVESNIVRPRPRFVFEAKRLRKNSHPIGNYVGGEGLQRFIQGHYASQCPEAAMLGYIQTSDAAYWIAELTRAFDSDANDNLRIRKNLDRVQVIESLSDELMSRHERRASDSITIYHVFLVCIACSPTTT